jgi:hypothetical protein
MAICILVTYRVSYFIYFGHILSTYECVIGLFDKNNVFCLFDPQYHSNLDNDVSATTERIFWDKGPKAIKLLIEQHALVCKKNPFCKAMRVNEIELESKVVSAVSLSSEHFPERLTSVHQSQGAQDLEEINELADDD